MKDTIKRLRELEASATPGEWKAVEFGWDKGITAVISPLPKGYTAAEEIVIRADEHGCSKEDFYLIAEMRNAIPQLLDRLEKLEAVAQAAQELEPYLEEDHNLVTALAALEEK